MRRERVEFPFIDLKEYKMEETQNTLRETLAEAITASEPVEVVTRIEPTETKPERVRDEVGKFANKAEIKEPIEPSVEPVAEIKPNRPSTWKKELWAKFDSSDPELQSYINQRESEYKSGVSTYKAEAERAKSLNEAIAPFIPQLQQNNIEPTQWIKNLGNAHQTLALGSPAQKMQMFQKLAQDYGVDLSGVAYQEQPQIDPNTQWLTQQVQGLSQTLNSFKDQQTQAEMGQLQSEIGKFAETAPHFEMVKADMSQLLEAGLANDLQSAYNKAIRMNDEAWGAEQDRLSQASNQVQVEAAKKAKTLAFSSKSSSPTGTAKGGTGKGLREQISASLDAFSSRV